MVPHTAQKSAPLRRGDVPAAAAGQGGRAGERLGPRLARRDPGHAAAAGAHPDGPVPCRPPAPAPNPPAARRPRRWSGRRDFAVGEDHRTRSRSRTRHPGPRPAPRCSDRRAAEMQDETLEAIALAPGEPAFLGGGPQAAVAVPEQGRDPVGGEALGGAVASPACASHAPTARRRGPDQERAVRLQEGVCTRAGEVRGPRSASHRFEAASQRASPPRVPTQTVPARSTTMLSTRVSGRPSFSSSGRSDPRWKRTTPEKVPTQMAPSAVSANPRTRELGRPSPTPSRLRLVPRIRESPCSRDAHPERSVGGLEHPLDVPLDDPGQALPVEGHHRLAIETDQPIGRPDPEVTAARGQEGAHRRALLHAGPGPARVLRVLIHGSTGIERLRFTRQAETRQQHAEQPHPRCGSSSLRPGHAGQFDTSDCCPCSPPLTFRARRGDFSR